MSNTETWSLIKQRNNLFDEVDRLRTRLAEVEESKRLLKEQVRVSDEAFNFHLKRANELMNKCNEVEADAAVMRGELDKLARLGNEPMYGNSKGNVIAQKALAATNAGKALLERLKEAERLLLSAPLSGGNWESQWDWENERDAFLNPTNKDVM